MGKLDGKIAIVTGAGQGVGRGIAIALANAGAAIAPVDMRSDTCTRTAGDIGAVGGQALPLLCDVRRREQVQAVVGEVEKQFRTVDILVNCAQNMRNEVPFEDTTDEDMALALESGLLGTFYFMQACFPHLKEHGGKIINLASSAGTQGAPRWAAYAAAREGIRALTRVAAHEWGKYKINVNAVCPLANSPRIQEWAQAFPDRMRSTLATIPMGRLGDCERDIGQVVVFLASSDSDYITGHTIMVDGGQTVLA